MFFIQTARYIFSKTDGNAAPLEEKSPSSLVIPCLKLVINFLKKKVGTQKIWVPTSESISAYYYSSSSRLVWSLWVAGAVLEDFFSVVVEVATAETLSLPATFIT